MGTFLFSGENASAQVQGASQGESPATEQTVIDRQTVPADKITLNNASAADVENADSLASEIIEVIRPLKEKLQKKGLRVEDSRIQWA